MFNQAIEHIRIRIEGERLEHTDLMDEANLGRLNEQMLSIRQQMYKADIQFQIHTHRDVAIDNVMQSNSQMLSSLGVTYNAIQQARENVSRFRSLLKQQMFYLYMLEGLNVTLTKLMEAQRCPDTDDFYCILAHWMEKMYFHPETHELWLYCQLKYGNWAKPSINAKFAKEHNMFLAEPVNDIGFLHPIIAREQRDILLRICRNALTQETINEIEEFYNFCVLLARPENHVKVASGVYKEVAVNIATTQEMVNQAVQILTDLPRFTAAAKTIYEGDDGEQSVWKGQIKTHPLPGGVNNPDIWQQITAMTHERCCKPRQEIEQEIAARRSQWRNTGGRGDRPSRKPTSRKTPPPSWG